MWSMATLRPHEIPQLGELLRRDGKLVASQIAAAVEIQREQGGRFGEILVAQGFLRREDLNLALRKQWRMRTFAAGVAATTALLSPFRVMAAPATTLTLTGFVPATASLAVSSSALALSFEGADGRTATAQVVEKAGATAYSVEVHSRSAGETGAPSLRAPDGAPGIPYRLTYGGSPVAFDNRGRAIVTRGAATGAAGAAKPLSVEVPQRPAADEAVSDTLTITVRTN